MIERALKSVIYKTSKFFPVVLITGPRQIGKTTLLEMCKEENRSYVSLDDPFIRELAKSDPALFLQKYESPLIIDEIQYAPELLPYIKIALDTQKKNGAFWLTGSQMFQTMKGVSESLAGRVGIIPMQGLSNSELNKIANEPFLPKLERLKERLLKFDDSKKMTVNEVYARIHKGSMPALYASEQSIERYYASYVDTYIQRDIRALSQVGDELQFQRFLVACAVRTSQMLNYTELANDVGISVPTAKKWLSILISLGVLVLIEPYYNNVLKRMVKAPNLYFMDTGLCAYLNRWTSADALEVSAMSGAFFETFVVSEIIKSYLNAGLRPRLFYYRDCDRKEIDLIIEENGILYPIEIKKTASPKKDADKHFSVLDKTGLKRGIGSIICMCEDFMPLNRETWTIPVWMI